MTELRERTAGLRTGDMLAQYRVEGPLGRGGQGLVWKAYDTKLDRIVALKQVSPVQAGDPEYVRAFRQECRLLARIGPKCPHIVTIFDFLEEPAGLFSVMEYVAGETLEGLIAGESLTDRQRFGVLVQLLMGLTEVHGSGIVHRDIKPANVLIEMMPAAAGAEAEFHVRLADFGLAGQIGGQGALPMGTTKYMAPETFRGGGIDARADLYAAGFVAYEIFAGRLFGKVFEDVVIDSRNEHLRWMQWHSGPAEAPPLSNLRPHVAELQWIAPVVAKLMAKDPARRYASAAEALADLRAAAQRPGPVVGTASLPAGPAAGIPNVPVPAAPAMPAPRGSFDPRMPGGGNNKSMTLSNVSYAPAQIGALAAGNGQVKPYSHADHDPKDDTRRLPDARPWFKRGPYLAAMVGGVVCAVLIALSVLKTDPIKRLQAECKKSWDEENWPVAIPKHRDYAALLAERFGEADRQTRLIRAVAELCEARSLEKADPAKARAMAEKLAAPLEELNKIVERDGTAREGIFLKANSELLRKNKPESEFREHLKRFADRLSVRDAQGVAFCVERMADLNKQHALGHGAEMATVNRLRQAFDDLAARHAALEKVVGKLENGALTVEAGRELNEIVAAEESIGSSLSQVNPTGELARLSDAIAKARADSRNDKDHATALLDVFALIKAGDNRLTKALAEIVDPKGKPGLSLREAGRNYDRALEIAKSLSDRMLGGIPQSVSSKAKADSVLCVDAEKFLNKYATLGVPEKVGMKTEPKVPKLTPTQLKEYYEEMSAIKANGNIERIPGAAAIFNLLEAEKTSREGGIEAAEKLKKFKELGEQARKAELDFDWPKVLEFRKQQAEVMPLPKDEEARVAELRRVLELMPILEEKGKKLNDVTRDVQTALRMPAKLFTVIPGQPADIRLGDMVKQLDDVVKESVDVIKDSQAVSLFKTVQHFKDKLSPVVRDRDTAETLVKNLSEAMADVIRYNNFIDDSAKFNVNKEPTKKLLPLIDAAKLAKAMQLKSATDKVSGELRSKLGAELERLARYEQDCINIDKTINFAKKAAETYESSSGEEKDRWLKSLRENVTTAKMLADKLGYPIDPARKAKLDECLKYLPK